MENYRTLVEKIILFSIGGTLLVLPFFVFAYDDKTTHPALTQEIIKFFNAESKDLKISSEDAKNIIQGSIDEDSGYRWMNHFYDPVHNRGLTITTKEQGLAIISASLENTLGKSGNWPSAKTWATNSQLQSGTSGLRAGILKNYFSSDSDYSWERSIYEYVWANKERGLKGLGHILHLLEDMNVPDHTRNDPHPPILDMGSPYESWTTRFNQNSITVDAKNLKLPVLPNLSDYFDAMANYSNNNFFSKDTIFDKIYPKPQILKEVIEYLNDEPTYFGINIDEGNIEYRLVKVKRHFGNNEIKYSVDDEKVLSDYWSLLSEQAVLHGAGVIKLFFDEVEKEKQTKILYEKNRSWLAKQIDKFWDSIFNIAGVLYGITVTPKDLEDDEQKIAEVQSQLATINPKVQPPITQTKLPVKKTEPPTENVLISTPEIPQATTVPILVIPNPESYARTNTYSDSPPKVPVSPPSSPPEETPLPIPPPPDTTPPDISLNIAECSSSLTISTCLIATTTITLSWLSTSSDLSYYLLECQLGNTSCANFNTASTTATTTIYTVPANNSIYIFKARAADQNGNISSPQIKTVEVATQPVIINEIAWTGTSAARSEDEWLELYNPTGQPLNLNGWVLRSATDNSPYINLSGVIPAKGFFLLERTNDQTVSDLTANQIYTGSLVNTGEVLELSFASTTIDKTPALNACIVNGWCGGAIGQYFSMERYDPFSSGVDPANWKTSSATLANGKNADNLNISGTPGKRNSINYFITIDNSLLAQNKTLKKTNSPYVVTTNYNIAAGAALTIEPGVVIKFYNNSGFHSSSFIVNGVIQAEGTADQPIVFTSFKDDTFAGDTNQDGLATSPQAGDWGSIKIAGNGSMFNQVVMKYGGYQDTFGEYGAIIRSENSSFTLRNSAVENSALWGLRLINSSSTIETSLIKNHNHDVSAAGIFAIDGSLEIKNNTFNNNTLGLQINTLGNNHNISITGNNFTQNTNYPVQIVSGYPFFSGNSASDNGLNGISLQGTITKDYTLTKDLPYVIGTTYAVGANKTLTIQPGTVFKIRGMAGISVSGKLMAEGFSESKIIFTSLNDDDCGIAGGCGDTNATTTPAQAGDWNNITFNPGAALSTMDHVVIRYGGSKFPLDPNIGAVIIKNSSVDIKNSTIEKNHLSGLWLQNSTSTSINNSLIQDHQNPVPGPFYGLFLNASSTPTIQNSRFKNNNIHIQSDGTSAYIDTGGNIFE